MGLAEADAAGPLDDPQGLAHALEPVLRAHTEGRLGPIEFFRSPWQRGGAATGLSLWTPAQGQAIPVFVKLPVGPVEFRWTTRLAQRAARDPCPPTPRVLASGNELGGYDLAWLITERFDDHPIAKDPTPESLHHLLEATHRFHTLAGPAEGLERPPKSPDFAWLTHKSRDAAREGAIPEAQRWNEALKKATRALPQILARWQARPIDTWCHGDVHPGNAMRRADEPDSCVLIDLALVHPGSWIEDALYLERQFWGHTDRLHGIKPLTELARLRREAGLPTGSAYPDLANVRRALAAMAAPAMLDREGHPAYLHGALETLERVLPQIH